MKACSRIAAFLPFKMRSLILSLTERGLSPFCMAAAAAAASAGEGPHSRSSSAIRSDQPSNMALAGGSLQQQQHSSKQGTSKSSLPRCEGHCSLRLTAAQS